MGAIDADRPRSRRQARDRVGVITADKEVPVVERASPGLEGESNVGKLAARFLAQCAGEIAGAHCEGRLGARGQHEKLPGT